jgi:type III pantothenate kinase
LKNLVLDFGNTRLKAALFSEKELIQKEVFLTIVEVIDFVTSLDCDSIILSSVLSENDTKFFVSQINKEIILLDAQLKLPIGISYDSPETLGKDRVANSCFALLANPEKNSLVIDIGTCVKFDFVSDSGDYQGGSISPGLNLRFKALNNYTGKLPLIKLEENYNKLIGTSTDSSILSGVKFGIQAEINGMIQMYEEQFQDLTIFITGGDADKFVINAKNTIFADPFITLKGLNEILLFNK